MLYVCVTWTPRVEDLKSVRAAHHQLLLRGVDFLQDSFVQICVRDDELRTYLDDHLQGSNSGSWELSCPAGRNTSSKVHHLRMFSRTRVQGGWPPPKHWGDRPQKNLRALGTSAQRSTTGVVRPRCGDQRSTRLGQCGEEQGQMTSWSREEGGITRAGMATRMQKSIGRSPKTRDY